MPTGLKKWLFDNQGEYNINNGGNCDISDNIVSVTDRHIIFIIIR